MKGYVKGGPLLALCPAGELTGNIWLAVVKLHAGLAGPLGVI